MKRLISVMVALILISNLLPPDTLTYAADTDISLSSKNAPVIACWGDSLTYGQGSTAISSKSYPALLSGMTGGLTVHNMGVVGETSVTIAARQGALDIKLEEPVTIPADTTAVEISIGAYNEDGSYAGLVVPRNVLLGGWTPCSINGVEGYLSVSVSDETPRTLNWAKFTRSTPGAEVVADVGSKITVAAHDIAQNADINIFFTGTNGGWNSNHTNPKDSEYSDLISLTDKMIAAAKSGSKSLVIGLTTGGGSTWEQTNAALKEKYGDHFIDAKGYLASEEALIDAGIAPTDSDISRLSTGSIPSSFLAEDLVHFNDLGYHLLAKLVYEKLVALGYVSQRTSVTTYKEATDAEDFNSYTASAGTVTTAKGFGGRRGDDESMKITYNGDYKDCYTNIASLPTIGTAPSVVSLSLYPSPDMSSFYFARGASEYTSTAITPSMLKMNQWNKITCFYDPISLTSRLFINGEEFSSTCDTQIDQPNRTEVRLIMFFTKDKAGAQFYYDDITVYTGGSFITPAIIGTQYFLQDKYLNKWGGDTVEILKTKIGLAASEYNINVYSESGTLKLDSELIASTDNVYICDGNTVLEKYYMGSETGMTVDISEIDALIAEYRTAAQLSTLEPLYYCTKGETETGVGGRSSSDASAKITYTGSGKDCFIDIAVPAAYTAKKLFVTADVYPNKNYGYFQFATDGSSSLSDKIPATALMQNQWNRISLVFDPSGPSSMVYINGTLYATYDSSVVNAIVTKIRLINWQTPNTAVNQVFYMDDIAIYSGNVLMPTITESSFDIIDKLMYETVGVTVGKLTNGLTLNNGYSVKVYSSAGTLKGTEDTIILGDTINIFFENILVEEYYAEAHMPPSSKTVYEFRDEADFEKLSAASYTEKSIAYGIGNSPEGDAAVKYIYTGSGKDCFFNLNLTAQQMQSDLAVAISFYPCTSFKSFVFSTSGGKPIATTVTPEMVNMNEWNRLVMLHDPKNSLSKLYVNGTFIEEFSNESNPINGHLRFICNMPSENYIGEEFYYDDIAVYSGNLVYPYISETDLAFSSKYINGWGNKTVSDLRDSITFSATTYSLRVLDSTNASKGNSAAIEKNDVIQIICDNTVLEEYYPGVELYEFKGTPVIFSNGYSSGENKFGVGTVTVKQKIYVPSHSMDVVAILVQYGAPESGLINSSVTPLTITEDDEIEASINIKECEGTSLKLFIWEQDSLIPLSNPVVFSPYSESKIEKVSPLYEGYSTKSAVFNYDDGVWQEYMLLDLLDEHGIKCTFNFISGKEGSAQPPLQSRKEGQLTRAKEAGDADALAASDWIDYVERAYIEKGHEIASHTKEHLPSHLDEGEIDYSSTGDKLVGVSTEAEVADIRDGVTDLESWFEGIDVIGLAWPNGFGTERSDYESDLLPAMKAVGLKYARSDESYNYELPTDWYKWAPTCHHNDAPTYANKFVSLDNIGDMKCFFTWGHAYEFANAGSDETKNWTMIEGVMETLTADESIWFATNGEIYRYVEATKLLETTDTTVKNNSTMVVYCQVNGINVKLAPGETYTIGQ